MNRYEFTFEVAPLSDEVEDAVYEADFDAVSSFHDGVGHLTVEFKGNEMMPAVVDGMHRLRALGVTILGLEDDLVTRRDIADRVGVSPQAVGLWVRGERGTNFPQPFNRVAGGVWLWSEVLPWLVARGQIEDDGLTRPDRIVSNLINGLILRPTSRIVFDWTYAHIAGPVVTVGPAMHHVRPAQPVSRQDWVRDAVDSKRTDFALSA